MKPRCSKFVNKLNISSYQNIILIKVQPKNLAMKILKTMMIMIKVLQLLTPTANAFCLTQALS